MADIEAMLRQLSNENTAKTFEYNHKEAKLSRTWQEKMSNTSHQREVEDLKNAGLNPVLSTNGGAQAYSASSASGTADNSAVGMLASIYQTKLNNENALRLAQMQNNNNLEIARINAAASKYSSDNAYAASRYASDTNYASTQYSSDKSYKGHTYGVDRTKYGMAYNAYTGLTGHTARQTGKTAQTLLGKAVQAVKNWFKK